MDIVEASKSYAICCTMPKSASNCGKNISRAQRWIANPMLRPFEISQLFVVSSKPYDGL